MVQENSRHCGWNLCPPMLVCNKTFGLVLFGIFVLSATARWRRKMLSGGSFFSEEKTCNLGNVWYNHETLERGEPSSLEGEKMA